MKPQQLDRMVQIGDVKIPAMNIQVEGFPKNIGKSNCGTTSLVLPVYFEIMFENGTLWVVESYSEDEIFVEQMMVVPESDGQIYPGWETFDFGCFSSWENFVDMYRNYIPWKKSWG